MSLTPDQVLRLHMEDGLAASAGTEPVAGVDFDPKLDMQLRQIVRDALTPRVVPAIAGAVMAKISAGRLPVGDAIRDQSSEDFEVSRSVMGSLGLSSGFSEHYRDAVKAEAGDFDGV